MKRLLKAELYKLSRDWLMLGILAVMMVLCIIFAGQANRSAEMIREYPIYFLNSQFGKNFQSLDDFLPWYEKYRVRTVIGNGICPLWCGVILAAFFIGREFDGRNVNSPLLRGHTRPSYFAAKWLVFFGMGEALSLFALLVTLPLFISGWHRLIPGGKLCLYFLVRITADLETLSVFFLAAFLGRDLIRTVSVSAAFALILSLVSGGSLKDTALVRVLQRLPFCKLQTVMKEGVLTWETLHVLLPVSLGLSAAAAGVSWLVFRKLELK